MWSQSFHLNAKDAEENIYFLLFTFVQFRSVPFYPVWSINRLYACKLRQYQCFSCRFLAKQNSLISIFTQRSAKKRKTYQKNLDICAKLTKVLNIPFKICDSSQDIEQKQKIAYLSMIATHCHHHWEMNRSGSHLCRGRVMQHQPSVIIIYRQHKN